MEIPLDLQELCVGPLTYEDDAGKLLLPPEEIREEVRQFFSTGKLSDLLAGWITVQQKTAEEAKALVDALPPFEGGEMPGWMGSKWAIRLGCPWGPGLPEAVAEGKAWLASQ